MPNALRSPTGRFPDVPHYNVFVQTRLFTNVMIEDDPESESHVILRCDRGHTDRVLRAAITKQVKIGGAS